jgi:hypothetical protein
MARYLFYSNKSDPDTLLSNSLTGSDSDVDNAYNQAVLNRGNFNFDGVDYDVSDIFYTRAYDATYANGMGPEYAQFHSETTYQLGTPALGDVDILVEPVTDTGASQTIYPFPDATIATADVDPPTATIALTTPAVAGTMAGGAYKFAYSYYVTNNGQTIASSIQDVTLVAGDKITVAAFTIPSGVTGVNFFLSAPDGDTLYYVTSKTAGTSFDITADPVETDWTQPDVPRNVTATAGGTAGDIKAITPSFGYLASDNVDDPIGYAQIETLPAFTVNTAGTVVGSKAVAKILWVTIPAHDGTGATTSFGTGAKLGLPVTMPRNNVVRAYLNNALEATAPTVAYDIDDIEGNLMTLSTALDGTPVSVVIAADA